MHIIKDFVPASIQLCHYSVYLKNDMLVGNIVKTIDGEFTLSLFGEVVMVSNRFDLIVARAEKANDSI